MLQYLNFSDLRFPLNCITSMFMILLYIECIHKQWYKEFQTLPIILTYVVYRTIVVVMMGHGQNM